jgi:hypothetical protein
MCNQAVSLVGTELERRGFPTVALRFRREAAEKPQPPRALLARFRHGFPRDPPNDPGRLLSMLEAAVRLLEDAETGPTLRDYRPVETRKDR